MIYFKKQIQEEIEHIKFQIKYLSNEEEIQEDISDEDVIVEAFQKDKIKQKIGLYKKAIKLFEKAIKLEGNPATYKERGSIIREALLIDLKADLMEIFYSKKDVYIQEEFKTFKKDF